MTFQIKESFVLYNNSPAMMPGIERAANGDLLVTYNTTIDRIVGGEAHLVRSNDQGRSWSDPIAIASSALDEGAVHLSLGIARLSTGKIIVPFNDGLGDPWKRTETNVLKLYLAESDDDGRSWSPPREIASELSHPVSYGKLLELQSGRLLLPIYGPDPAGSGLRAAVLISDDGGVNWDNIATVARTQSSEMFDIGYGQKRAGGFNETTIAQLPNGDLVAVIRQQFIDGDQLKYLYAARSTDDGSTWSEPERLDIRGTSPSLHVTNSGRLLLGYRTYRHEPTTFLDRGRPVYRTDGVGVSWSDDGITWDGEVLLEDPNQHSFEREFEAGYPAMINLSTGDVLVAFYSYDERISLPANFASPYHFYLAANILIQQ